MKFRQIRSPQISVDGGWITLAAVPDRGDPEVEVHSTDGKSHHHIPLASDPIFSGDGEWVGAVRPLPAAVVLAPDAEKKTSTLKPGMVLLETGSGKRDTFQRVTGFRFTNDSRWLLIHHFPDTALGSSPLKNTGTGLRLFSLDDTAGRTFNWVTRFEADSMSRFLAMAVSDTSGLKNGVYLLDLTHPGEEALRIWGDSGIWADDLAWNNRTGTLAFLSGEMDAKDQRKGAALYLWTPGSERAEAVLRNADIYPENELAWSKDGRRLFLGTKPESEIVEEEKVRDSVFHLYDTASILNDRGVDVWHWNDPYIIPNQKIRWKREKDRTYQAVFYPENSRLVQLATPEIPEVRMSESSSYLLASTNIPYAKRVTWEGTIRDYYLVDQASGDRRLVVEGQEHSVSLSPDGKYLVYFARGDWYMVESATMETRNLTESLGVTFADEDWDYPASPPDYRTAGWVEGAGSVLIYDKYDIWQFFSNGSEPVCLTEGKGRREHYTFRIYMLERDRPFFEEGEQVWLSATHELKKHTAIYSMHIGEPGVTSLMEDPCKYTLLARAEDSDQLLYTRETYTEFPDLWVAGPRFRDQRRLTRINPQTDDFAWGEAELVEWSSLDGTPLQGVLIRPGNDEPGRQYPVLVYYYRIFSNRLYEFNEVAVNHRPCFPFYASNGYAIFLPDIRFDVGTPGYSATKCLVPGVQKIIDMGIADPEAIALHGHSWSGYQTAFVITQTNLFACAIAGAPVSNMTSAYSGIRWESGLARQFQYEQSQSRIGGSLWEARDKYIENSPVFFADRIQTPLLIQFGDQDGAVPWYQGIELYLAMRRLEKECVFLEYRDEPHHLKKYANKLDYTLKFKAYLDHYLKGAPSPEWLEKGIPYRGD